jgi:predicted O-methyltransferase YrrM
MNDQMLRDYALQHAIPIIEEGVVDYFKSLFQTHTIKHVLEIGTAMSYSAHVMASLGAQVDTIERNETMMKHSQEILKDSPLKSNIHVIFDDALTMPIPNKVYDLIFIDGAKSQYTNFFKRFSPLLKKGGFIICDNMHFHHLNPLEVKRHTRQLLKKIDRFKSFLLENQQFDTEFLNVGDGLSVSVKR